MVTDLATSFSTELIGTYPFFFGGVGAGVGGTSLVAQLVKNPPAVQETLVRFLGQENPLEKGQATHSSILGLPLWLSW